MGGVENNGIFLGKNQKINFENFNGIQKKDFSNTVKGSLVDFLFSKYDTNKDDILDESELKALQNDIKQFAEDDTLGKRETKKFFKSLGLEKGHDLKRDDLYNFLQAIQSDKDSISRAVKSEDGKSTLVEYKPDANNIITRVLYSNEQNGSHNKLMEQFIADDYTKTLSYNDDGTTLLDEVTENKRTQTQYDSSGKPIAMVEQDLANNNIVTSEFGEDGKTITSKYRQNGAVTEFLDPNNNDRVIARVTDKGNGVKESVQFSYNEDGSITETFLNENSQPVSSVTKKDGKEIQNTSISTADDGSSTEIAVIGEGDNAQRLKIQKDKEGNVTSKVNVDKDGNPVAYKHKVNAGENWYGIVQAKYGITSYSTIMEIVHQLKKNAGVRRSSSVMPSEIELPPTVTLKDGTTINLKNIDAKFDELNSANATIDISKIKLPDNVPQAYTKDKLATIEQNITIPQEYLAVKPENAGKTITQSDGKIIEYNDAGKVLSVYNSEADLKTGNRVGKFIYDSAGNFLQYQVNKFNEKGNFIGGYQYDSNGKLVKFFINDAIDPETGLYKRQVNYDSDGNIDFFLDIEYDENGKETGYNLFKKNDNGQFNFLERLENKYSNDGTQKRELIYNAEGNLENDKLYDV